MGEQRRKSFSIAISVKGMMGVSVQNSKDLEMSWFLHPCGWNKNLLEDIPIFPRRIFLASLGKHKMLYSLNRE